MTEPAGPLAEEAAWALVRAAARPGEGGRSGARRIHSPDPAVWLDVDDAGTWEAPMEVAPAARALLDLYLPVALPEALVIGQLGQSLDGRIATEAGDSTWVTGPEDIVRLHRLRALVDAVVVGAETVALDDPRLTVRRVDGPNPVRVVLDPGGRLDRGRQVFSDGASRTVVVRAGASGEEGGAPERGPPAIEIVRLPAGPDGFEPASVVAALRSRGLRRILVEGGGITVSRFVQADVLDRLHVTVAPLLIGSGRPALTLPPIATLSEARRVRCRHHLLGADVLFDLDLR